MSHLLLTLLSRSSDTKSVDKTTPLTIRQLAAILRCNENTVETLAKGGRIPSMETADGGRVFLPEAIDACLKRGRILTASEEQAWLDSLRAEWEAKYPEAIASIREIDKSFADRRVKGYSLHKVPNKKHGFLYYVRFTEHGKIYSRWNTYTNNLEEAERWARDNRDRILAAIHERTQGQSAFYGLLESYYAKGSPYMQTNERRGMTLSEQARYMRHNFITGKIIPYFKSHGIRSFSDVTPGEVTKLEDWLLARGNKPQTARKNMGYIRKIFDYLVARGEVEINPFRGRVPVKTKQSDVTVRGCYEIDSLHGLFKKEWETPLHYLLCLLVYSTDMRNSEISRVREASLFNIDGVHFIDIAASKTESGVRAVPLHPFVYERLTRYFKDGGLESGAVLGSAIGSHTYEAAAAEMGRMLGKTPEWLRAQNITFYSGRHFWKTMMDVEGLGDAAEYFMGHRVTQDVAKSYNHKDKVGRENLLGKARQVFSVLDKYLFA